MPVPDKAPVSTSERFHFIDDLRGIACICVVLHHCRYYAPFKEVFTANIPTLVLKVLNTMNLGVTLFFIISGFVIAHSLSHSNLHRPAIINFILRRHIRLDPPYWAAMFFYLALNTISHAKMYSLSLWSGLANVFYLQYLLQFPSDKIIVGVSWTLCIEVQFYLAFLFLLWIGNKKRHAETASSEYFPFSPLAIALLFSTGAACLIFRSFVTINSNMLGHWQYFVAGVICYLIYRNILARHFLWIYLGLFGILIIGFPRGGSVAPDHSRLGMSIGAALILLVYYLGKRYKNQETPSTPHPVLRFFSTISYSLYLIHTPIINLIYAKGFAFSGPRYGPAVFYFLFAALTSIAVATLFQRWVETPALNWSRRLKVT